MSFLTAEWRKLALLNYEVDSTILMDLVPKGTELDFWNGQCILSLVGFRFINTKLLGINIPFHVNFEEVNLRFYVKREVGGQTRRGVVFIKEIVPRYAISFIANQFYGEHYQTLPMKYSCLIQKDLFNVSYSWKIKNHWQFFGVASKAEPEPIVPGSNVEFITEHYWGYTQRTGQYSSEYEVRHPIWEHYPVLRTKVEVDFGLTYGKQFEFLNNQLPVSAMLAEGSKITVERKSRIG